MRVPIILVWEKTVTDSKNPANKNSGGFFIGIGLYTQNTICRLSVIERYYPIFLVKSLVYKPVIHKEQTLFSGEKISF
jgi:hypothetical protein